MHPPQIVDQLSTMLGRRVHLRETTYPAVVDRETVCVDVPFGRGAAYLRIVGAMQSELGPFEWAVIDAAAYLLDLGAGLAASRDTVLTGLMDADRRRRREALGEVRARRWVDGRTDDLDVLVVRLDAARELAVTAFGRHLALTLHGAVHFVGIRDGAAVFLAAPVRDIDDLTDAVAREAAVHGVVPRGLGMATCGAVETDIDAAVERAIASARLRATLPDQVASVRAEDLGGWALLHTVPRSRPLLHQACPAAFDLLALDDPTPRETVEAYLDAAGRVPVACERLHIHRTTLYYRLEHLPESVRTALADGLQRTTLHLALKLLRLWEEEASEAAVVPLREEGLLRA
ncbi:hypothetical protein NS206_16465 [Microbacterium testaceum]|uniref:helix-turn-helix domain-containing protein n=1 Tax=Microbacterium testaceum TaxID=2033 RepID=UPI000734895B|nr:helix-turn-helix domain-containing protein [Microbacterium testaceum]KTS55466.1 hypothetical protein NS206_16465 [Microbacterium testaceum]